MAAALPPCGLMKQELKENKWIDMDGCCSAKYGPKRADGTYAVCGEPYANHLSTTAAASSSSSVDPRLDIRAATMLAASAGCRHLIELFAKDLQDKHKHVSSYKSKCGEDLSDSSTTYILTHFESCPAVADSDAQLLGRDLTKKLKKRKVRPPSEGSFKDVFSKLSDIVHSELHTTTDGKVIVPTKFAGSERRFLIRYLIARGEDVVIFNSATLKLESVTESDITTPPLFSSPSAQSPPRVQLPSAEQAKKKKGKKRSKSMDQEVDDEQAEKDKPIETISEESTVKSKKKKPKNEQVMVNRGER